MSVDKDKQVSKVKPPSLAPTGKLRELLDDPTIKDQFQRAMAEKAPAFMAAIVELVATDSGLQECPPGAVIKEALKAATMGIPLNRALGFAYILPFNIKQADNTYVKMPTFIPGYRLFIQLAMRSKEYKTINAEPVYEGQVVDKDTLTGKIAISGEPTSEKAIGYVAYFELKSGFAKALYMTRAQVVKHAERFSKSYKQKGGVWVDDFDAMAVKTVLKALLSKYGPLSISSPLMELLAQEDEDDAQAEIETAANREALEPGSAPAALESGQPTTTPPEPAKPPF